MRADSHVLQGYAEDTDSSKINEAVSTAPEDDSSQPSGWQPSSNTLPWNPSLILSHATVCHACNWARRLCIAYATHYLCNCSTASSYLQVGHLTSRRRKRRNHRPWMVRSNNLQSAHVQSKLKTVSSQKPGLQESPDAILQTAALCSCLTLT